MATDDQSSPPPVRASERDWKRIADSWAWSPSLCLLELRDRVAALEAAGGRAHAAPAGGGLTVERLAECLPGNAWQGPEGYNRRFFAEHLLSHPITGPRLRGEGAAAPKRVVLAEDPPEADTPRCWRRIDGPYKTAWQEGYAAGWAAARTEVERRQGGQADG